MTAVYGYVLHAYRWGAEVVEPITVRVSFRKVDHWNTTDPRMKAYDVVDARTDEVVGRISRSLESTDRHYGRIRVPGKGRLAWSWETKNTGTRESRRNSPGVYAHTRAEAVAKIYGYDYTTTTKGGTPS